MFPCRHSSCAQGPHHASIRTLGDLLLRSVHSEVSTRPGHFQRQTLAKGRTPTRWPCRDRPIPSETGVAVWICGAALQRDRIAWEDRLVLPRICDGRGRSRLAGDQEEQHYGKNREGAANGTRDMWRLQLLHNPNLDSIRDTPEFAAVVAEIEADMATQLARVHEMQRSGELTATPGLAAD
jgi:hypothetical protein